MLHYLVERAGRLVTQDELLEALWPETYVQPEVLKSHIRDIRSALGDDPKVPRFIETMPRRGYLFIAAVKESVGNDVLGVEPAASNLVGRKAELDRLQGYFQRALQDPSGDSYRFVAEGPEAGTRRAPGCGQPGLSSP